MPLTSKRFSAKEKIEIVLDEIYTLLYKTYGPRHWWPAKTPFEVAVGAILTQNTNWANTEKAIQNLKGAGLLSPVRLNGLSIRRLAGLIRPCGYYNIKAKRLKNFLELLFKRYGGRLSAMQREALPLLRNRLLGVKGIGQETADSIMLYALKKPVFVVDAYTKRILGCLGIADDGTDYSTIQSIFMESLPSSARLFNEYHALLVEHAKRVCRKPPNCKRCVLHCLKKV